MDEPDAIDEDSTPDDLIDAAITLNELGRFDDELAVYSEVVARFGDDQDPDVQWNVARALRFAAMTYAESDRADEAIAAYRDVVRRFGSASDSDLHDQVAKALLGQSKLVEDSEAVLLSAQAMDRLENSADSRLIASGFTVLIAALARLEQRQEIVVALDDMLGRVGDENDPEVESCVAFALSKAGAGLTGVGRLAGEFVVSQASYDRMCTALAIEPSRKAEMAQQFRAIGVILGERNAPSVDERAYLDRGIAAFTELVERFADSDSRALRDEVAEGLVSKAMVLDGRLLRPSEAIEAFDEVVERFLNTDEPFVQWQVARALVGRGDALVTLARPDEALATYGEVFAHFAGSEDAWLQQMAARGLARNASLLFGLGRVDDALTVLGDVSDRFGGVPGGMRAEVASVLVGIAGLLMTLGRHDESLAVFEDVLRRYRGEPELRYQVACAVMGSSGALERLGRSEEALTAVDEVMDWPTDSDDARLRFVLAMVHGFKAMVLSESLHRTAEAHAVFEDLVSRFENDDNEAVRGVVADARTEFGS